jgi:hypothetical protein
LNSGLVLFKRLSEKRRQEGSNLAKKTNELPKTTGAVDRSLVSRKL